MVSLTIAEVAGVINVGIVVFQFTFPLILMFILVGIAAHANNAATWSVAGRLLHGTWWPSILGSDTAAMRNVNGRVLAISISSAIGLSLLAIAAVVTPLGLYDSFTQTSELANFQYIHDSSAFGIATPNRDDYNISRLCGSLMYKPCAGQDHGFGDWFTNATGGYTESDPGPEDYISSIMPTNLTEMWSSGRDHDMKTVATPFDIEFRSYVVKRTPDVQETIPNATAPRYNIDQQRPRTVGDYKTFENFLLDDGFVIKNGIIGDMSNGGVGLRNHTLPSNIRLGAEWTESLLWIEPETLCLSNNISLEFQAEVQLLGDPHIYLVDRGGLLRIQDGIEYPQYDYEHTQVNPELYGRAFKGATLVNYNTALFLNVTKKSNTTYLGRRFQLRDAIAYAPNQIVTGSFGLGIPDSGLGSLTYQRSMNLTDKVVDSIDLLVSGYGGTDVANISRVAAGGGMVIGAPLVVGNNSNGRFDPGQNYTAPIFSCASVLKAYIMDVTFFVNGTSDLSNLRVKKATPRVYTNTTAPLWAIEKPGDNFFVGDQDSLWGIVDDRYENDTSIWTTRRPHLYLPAGASSLTLGSLFTEDSLAVGAFENILSVLYNQAANSNLGDITGKYSYSMASKMSKLSQSAETVPKMMSLIWTTMAVNSITSRRSQLNADLRSVTTAAEAAQQATPSTVPVSVIYYNHAVRFNLVYAIPAFIFLAFYVALLIYAIILRVMNHSTLPMLRSLLNQTSVGRAVLIERMDREDTDASTRMRRMNTADWVKEHGPEDIGIQKDTKYALLNPEQSGMVGVDQKYPIMEVSGR